MDKIKIAENIYEYYKRMLMLKKKVLLHENNYISLDEFFKMISSTKDKVDKNNAVSRVLLTDEEIEELCLYLKEAVLEKKEFLAQNGRDYHIIRQLLMGVSKSDELSLFCKLDECVGIDPNFSEFMNSKSDNICFGKYDLSRENNFDDIESKAIFLEDVYVVDYENLGEYFGDDIRDYVSNIIMRAKAGDYLNDDKKDSFKSNVINKEPRVVFIDDNRGCGRLGIYNFTDDVDKMLDPMHYIKYVKELEKKELIPLKDLLVNNGLYLENYFSDQSLNDVLFALDRLDCLSNEEKEVFLRHVECAVDKIMETLTSGDMNPKGNNLADRIFASRENAEFMDEQLKKFRNYIEVMIRIVILARNAYDLSSGYTVHSLYMEAAKYANMNLVNFPNLDLICGMNYVISYGETIKIGTKEK